MFSAFFLAWKNLPRGRGGVGGDQKTEILSITSYYIFAVKAWKARKPWNIEQDKKTVFVASVLSSLIFFLAQQTSNIQEKGFAPRSPVSNYTISVKKSPPQIVALVKNSEGGAWWNTWWRGKYASINIIIPFWRRPIHHWKFWYKKGSNCPTLRSNWGKPAYSRMDEEYLDDFQRRGFCNKHVCKWASW